MAINLPGLNHEDLRNPVAGDSYSWYGIEPTAAKKSLVIHHSASPTNQDGFVIAQHHVNKGWNGIGYNFVIRHDSHPKGAGIEYVGDLATYRAHVANDNPGRVGICMVGNFLNHMPGPRQLELTRYLIDFLRAPNNILPSINFYSQVAAHGLIPGQATACPGHAHPQFNDWFNYLKGGAFPHHLYAASPPPPPPTPILVVTPQPIVIPEPVVEVPTPPTPGEVFTPEPPEWVRTWRDEETHSRKTLVITNVIDVTTGAVKYTLQPGFEIKDIVGYFTYQGTEWARTKYSRDKGLYNGVKSGDLAPREVKIPFTVKTTEDLLGDVFNQVPSQIANLPREVRENVIERFWAFLKDVVGIIIAPLLKLITKKD